VQAEWFDVLGLSAGHVARADWLRQCITAVRPASRNPGIGVLVGGPWFVDATVGADGVGADAVITGALPGVAARPPSLSV
jgi:hypothetical protein